MKTRTILLTGAGILLAIAIVDAGSAFIGSRQAIAGPLDLSAVDTIEVTGDASLIRLSTDTGQPLEAKLDGRREGWGALWRSSWFSSDDCTPDASMQIVDRRLQVTVGDNRGIMDWSDCRVEVGANLKAGSAVIIDQAATRSEVEGNYSVVRIASDAGDISFDGHATALSISGAAVRARLVYRDVSQNETIQLFGKMMDASIRFLQPVPISYLVEATASLVNSKLPNTPGAKPAITVRGEMLRLSIE